MKRYAFAALLSFAGMAICQTNWLGVYGDSSDPRVDSIEVDPRPLSVDGNIRIMRIRASRGQLQTTAEGIPYRSFEAAVAFDCENQTAVYVSATLYMQPTWKGSSHKIFSAAEVRRPMEFTGANPNPKMRLTRAACITNASISAVQ